VQGNNYSTIEPISQTFDIDLFFYKKKQGISAIEIIFSRKILLFCYKIKEKHKKI
jgi:hypothetical protein